jgi:RHS repeat-associated protein
MYRFAKLQRPLGGASRKRGRTNMAVTNYYTVNGEIIGERTAGSARVDYLTDALGSITATVNSSAQVVNTYRYKPYGAQLAKTGPGPDPAFQWVGNQGYGPTTRRFSEYYLRGRHTDIATGRFPSRDPIGLLGGINPYAYAGGEPTDLGDPSGLGPPVLPPPPPPIIRPAPKIPGIPRGARLPAPPEIPSNRIPVPDFRQPMEFPAPCPYVRPAFAFCGIVIGVGYLLTCPTDAGPRPETKNTCANMYPGRPRSNSVYYPPSYTRSFYVPAIPPAPDSSACTQAANNALVALRRDIGGPNTVISTEPLVAIPGATGPCPGNSLHQNVNERVRGFRTKQIASIVCCRTCDPLPESGVAEPGCKCAVLQSGDAGQQRRSPWRWGS